MAGKFEVVLKASLDKSSISEIQSQIENLAKGKTIKINANNTQVNNLNNSLKDFNGSVKSAQNSAQGLSDIISKFSSWQIVGDVIHGVKNAMEDMVQQVFDLDESLTELDKVTDLSSEGLQSLADDAFEVGEKIGATRKRCYRCYNNV